MPRISPYRPDKGNDYHYIDELVREQYSVGGTDLFLHKYLGPKLPSENDATATQPLYSFIDETNIQDLLFLENRDRKYDPDVYHLRCAYNVQDNDFNLSQFGLFFDSDILYITIHINHSVKVIGRKIMSGDVIELPHLKDEYALNDYSVSLKRFYVVEDVTRAAEGFSITWYPHLYRIKLKQITDSQEFKDILDLPADEENPENGTLRDVLGMGGAELDINHKIIQQAEKDSLKSGWNVQHYYHVSRDENGTVLTRLNKTVNSPKRLDYNGYLLGDDFAPNGIPFGTGLQFPIDADEGDYFLRLDFLPNRLFRFSGESWIKMYDKVRMTLNNSDDRMTQKWSFINNEAGVSLHDKVASDSVILNKGDFIITTSIEYPIEARYVELFSDYEDKVYDMQENTEMLSVSSENTIIITLPNNPVQDTVNFDAQYDIYFYNHAEKERQSITSVLRPKADF